MKLKHLKWGGYMKVIVRIETSKIFLVPFGGWTGCDSQKVRT